MKPEIELSFALHQRRFWKESDLLYKNGCIFFDN